MSHVPRLVDTRLSRALAALLLAASATCVHAAGCGRPCVVPADSVVNAAGTDPKIKQAIEAIRFDGSNLATSSRAEVRQLAAAWAKTPSGVLALTVHADTGKSSMRARSQMKSRAKTLQNELVTAGLPKARVQVSAAK